MAEPAPPGDDASAALKRWLVAGTVAFAALVGTLILVVLVVAAVRPAPWIETLMAVGLPLAAAGLAWLVASALGRNRPSS